MKPGRGIFCPFRVNPRIFSGPPTLSPSLPIRPPSCRLFSLFQPFPLPLHSIHRFTFIFFVSSIFFPRSMRSPCRFLSPFLSRILVSIYSFLFFLSFSYMFSFSSRSLLLGTTFCRLRIIRCRCVILLFRILYFNFHVAM